MRRPGLKIGLIQSRTNYFICQSASPLAPQWERYPAEFRHYVAGRDAVEGAWLRL